MGSVVKAIGGLFGGGSKSKGPTGPTAADDFSTAKNYWQDYSTWMQEEKAGYEKDIASYRAQGAASGGTGMYDTLAKERTTKYEEAVKGINAGERGKSLSGFEKDFRQSLLGKVSGKGGGRYAAQMGAVNTKGLTADQVNKMDMGQLYETIFGKPSIGPGDKEQEAIDRAKSFGGGRKGAAGSSKPVPSAVSGFFEADQQGQWW